MRYGLPYKGSKNGIVLFLIDIFPKKKNFYDLFAGGCAITHGALLSGKFDNYFVNDISDYSEIFKKAIVGDFKNEKRWISREDFFRLKDSDPYIRYCWSFGNNGKNYMYSKEIEPWKKALHYARVFNDFSLLEEFGIKTDKADRITVVRNADEWKKKYIEWAIKYFAFTDEEIEKYNQYKKEGVFENLIPGSVGLVQLKKRLRRLERLQSLQSLERLQSLESLERLQSLERLERLESLERLTITQKSYNEVEILPDSLIYCDIPYKNTNSYIGGFNHDEFYKWCRKQKELVIVSEYAMPDDFICITQIKKRVTLQSGVVNYATEKLFIPKHQKDLWENKKTLLNTNRYRQLELEFCA
ncbi:MAG: DNA adenine methylase [Treponema sp.]|nr:DNA adenine methylase [Treponema sp.]MBR0487582.1 DNA adenine methylase [Treponema sp.]